MISLVPRNLLRNGNEKLCRKFEFPGIGNPFLYTRMCIDFQEFIVFVSALESGQSNWDRNMFIHIFIRYQSEFNILKYLWRCQTFLFNLCLCFSACR
jgi:hypothetical protein